MKISDPKVLIVDDDEIVRSIIEEFLRLSGVGRIESAANGLEARRRIHDSAPPFDLLLLDILMPECDGLELVQALADDGFSGRIAGISGAGAELLGILRLYAEEKGLRFIGTIKKPIRLDDIENLVAACGPEAV